MQTMIYTPKWDTADNLLHEINTHAQSEKDVLYPDDCEFDFETGTYTYFDENGIVLIQFFSLPPV